MELLYILGNRLRLNKMKKRRKTLKDQEWMYG